MRKVYSNSEKIKLVLSSFGDKIVITRYCADRGISRSTYYRWRRWLLKGLSKFMGDNKPLSQGQRNLFAGKHKMGLGKSRYRCRIK